MNRLLAIALAILILLTSCGRKRSSVKRIELATARNTILYLDQIPGQMTRGISKTDSAAVIHNYINNWVRKQLLLQKAQDNLSPEKKNEINDQVEEARSNLIVYEYQRQMMIEKMDTVVTDEELKNYYDSNHSSFTLSSNIVKALLIKLPLETPGIDKIRRLARSNDQKDLQNLETLCYQFADKFDDFNEQWVTLDRISVELPQEISNEENFLKYNTFYETRDSSFLYILNLRDYRLRSTLAPFEYVRNDIKRIIWNNRRIEFFRNLENGIYNDALKENNFKIF